MLPLARGHALDGGPLARFHRDAAEEPWTRSPPPQEPVSAPTLGAPVPGPPRPPAPPGGPHTRHWSPRAATGGDPALMPAPRPPAGGDPALTPAPRPPASSGRTSGPNS